MTATISVKQDTEVLMAQCSVKGPRHRYLPWSVIALALVLFILGERTIPSAAASQFGLLAVASPMYGISILLAAAAFVVSIRQGNFGAAIGATAMMVIAQRLPTATATDLPMYAWTYKHLGVVDYIEHSHSLARDVDIYNSWPGMFAVTAWFSELTGISAVTIAHWFTPVFHALFCIVLYAAARAWRLNEINAITATFMVATLNWVAQDYFSPQATAIFLTVVIIALVGMSRDRPVGTIFILVVFAAVTITHQLTPFWIYGATVLLAVSRMLKPWWIIIPMGAILVGFLIFNWTSASHYELFSANPVKNAESNIPTVGVLGQRITSAGVRGLSAAMWLSTVLVLLHRARKKQEFWALGVLSLSPMLILGGQSYGGEAVFRVFLYSLTGCSFVLAPVLVNLIRGSYRKLWPAIAIVAVATAAAAQGYLGSWYANVMPKIQYDTSRIVLTQAELPAYLTSVAPVWPERSTWRYVDYARFNPSYDAPMTFARDLMLRHYNTDADYEAFIRALVARQDASTYLIFTDQMRVYAWYFGIMPWDAFPNLKARIDADKERWEPLYEGQGITVYVHRVRLGNR